MDAERIRHLVDYIPEASGYFARFFNAHTGKLQRDVGKFLAAYKDLAFGFHFVKSLTGAGLKLPPSLDEEWIRRLWEVESFGFDDGVIVRAVALHHPSMWFQTNAIKAFLVSNTSFQDITSMTGFDEEVLRAYEQLFFNIVDRRKEALFLAEVVYPDTRLVETMEGYIRDVDPGSMMMRSGYNNGPTDVAYFAGLKVPDHVTNSDNVNEMAGKLEATLMANAYFLSRNGYLNQRSAQGINSAKGLIVAAKQGGQDSVQEDHYGATSIGEALIDHMLKVKGPEMEERIKMLEDDSHG